MAHDAALREKAKEMFVTNGFSMDTIQTMMPEVSRKTIYNWRKEDNWEELRRGRVDRTKTRRERIEALIDRLLDEADVVVDAKLIFSIGKLVTALKSTTTFEFSEDKKADEVKKEQGISDDTWAKIEERLGL